MSGEKYNNFSLSFNGLQKEINEFVRRRNQLKKKIRNYINKFQKIESEVYKSLFDARKYHVKKRNFYNKKIKKLRRKKIEFAQLLNNLVEKQKTLQKPNVNTNALKIVDSFKQSTKEIDLKLEYLNERIKNQILDINKENTFVDKIRRLERKKQKRIHLISKIEKEQFIELQESDYYKIHKKIELLEMRLKEIYKHLNKWSIKKQKSHKKMLDLYRKAKEFQNFKNKMEKELKINKKSANDYYQNFLKISVSKEEILRNEKRNKLEGKQRHRQIKTPRLDYIIERKKIYKKFIREKLVVALEKKKAGKKLDISEYRLILNQSKK